MTAANTWYAFEFEVLISNTAGYMNVRKNGNPVNDFASATNLNTRTTANNYANRLQVGGNVTLNAQNFDDLLWRSDATSVPWVGDVRCYTRMPASDASTQFSKSPATTSIGPVSSTTAAKAANAASYVPFTATFTGTISAISVLLSTGATGHFNAAIYDATGVSNGPVNVLATGIPITNPGPGANVVTLVAPLSVTKGTQYVLAVDQDTSITYTATNYGGSGSWFGTTTYASFPAASPNPTLNIATAGNPTYTMILTLSRNAELVNEAQQDGTTSYVYDSTASDADFYNIAAIGITPASTIAVITRGFVEKSDAGTRTAAVQLKSGATTVQSTPSAMSTNFGWMYRVDTVDPATSAAWTAVAVNNAQIGPVVVT